MSNNNPYPSPSAAQIGSGNGPYTGRQSDAEEEMELRAHLSHEIGHVGTSDINPNLYSTAHGEQDQAFSHQMTYAYQQGTMPDGQGHSMPGAQQHVLMNNQHSPVSAALPNDTPSNKKTKASRACDECRRKKIKCDADTENPGLVCTNCKRTHSACLFSKPAQKRGPSRGYIRDLSDRVAHLEREKSATSKFGLGAFSTPNKDSPLANFDATSNKRTHSMSEGTSSASGFVIAKEYYPGTGPVAPFANMGFPSLTTGQEFSGSGSTPAKLRHEEEELLQSYFNIVHAGFPLISNEHSEVQMMLGACAENLRNAFFMAICGVSVLLESDDVSQCLAAHKEVMKLAGYHSSRTHFANIIYLQSLALLIYATSICSHRAALGTIGLGNGPLYGAAADIISHLKLRKTSYKNISDLPDLALVQRSGRRALWYIAIIDAWDALGYGDVPLIALGSIDLERENEDRPGKNWHMEAEREDKALLGNNWHMMAAMLRPLYKIKSQLGSPDAADLKVVDMVAELLSIARGLSDTALSATSMADIACSGLQMIVARLRLNKKPKIPDADMISEATATLHCLLHADKAERNASPFTHHVMILVAKLYLDAASFKSVEEESRKALELLVEALKGADAVGPKAWREVILRACSAKLQSLGGLQNLANAAVNIGESGERGEKKETGLDMTSVLLDGYLNCLLP